MTGIPLLDVFLVIWIVSAAVMGAAWLIQRFTGDAGIVDVAWSAGIGFAAVGLALALDGPPMRRFFVALLAGVWSLRLAGYILIDRVLSSTEDGRYRELRESLGARIQTFLFWFFQAQGLLVAVFALPIAVAMRRVAPFPDAWDAVGLAVWIVAVGGESLADRQLARFRADPSNRGRTCREGLWRWSRHPNYFFEWVHWWAYVAIGILAPLGGLTLMGPVLMFLFLWRVTGIPATERQALRSRGDDYRRYQETTSAFFPWPPRDERP